MITAIDSSVLWTIVKQQPGAREWTQLLVHLASQGPLVVTPVVFAELSTSAPDVEGLSRILEGLQIQYDSISPEAAFVAGQAFRRYRSAGGPREHLLPDFLIAGHAQVQADRLAASDQGYLRKWFPNLVLVGI